MYEKEFPLNETMIKNYMLLSPVNQIDAIQMLVSLIVPVLIMLMVRFMYRWMNPHKMQTNDFQFSLVIFSALSAFLSIIIGESLPIAVGLVGALSLIRFRVAIRSIGDGVLIFWAMVVGVACGRGYFVPVILANVVLIIMMVAVHKAFFQGKIERFYLFQAKFKDLNYEKLIERTNNYLKEHKLNFELMATHRESDEVPFVTVYRIKLNEGDDIEEILKGTTSIEHLIDSHIRPYDMTLYEV